MKLAVITDTTAVLSDDIKQKENLHNFGYSNHDW